jgi:ACS family sodium-dependent inorganic phosphate cotransporter
VVYPAIHAVWSKWAPIHERSRLATIAFSGSYVGIVVALPVSGLLSEMWGWESIFYAFGVLALIWTFFWFSTVGETPSEDKRISEDEIDYITSSIGPPSPTVYVYTLLLKL